MPTNSMYVKFRDGHFTLYDLGDELSWHLDSISLVLTPTSGAEISIPLCNVLYWEPVKVGVPDDPVPAEPTRDHIVVAMTMAGERWDHGPIYDYSVEVNYVYAEIDILTIDGRCKIRCYPLDAVRSVTVTDAE